MDIYRFRLPGFERPYGRQLKNQGVVVNLSLQKKSQSDTKDDLDEICELTRSAGIKTLSAQNVYVPHPSPKYFLREGKLADIAAEIKKCSADIFILNRDISPSQTANLEEFLKLPVIDRTALILEIFGRRAHSKEGKLQVELAQLHYALPRIGGLGTVMSRLGGGIGSRGPGEQELERDRRKVRRRIQQVKDDLQGVEKHRLLLRSGREKKGFKMIALVGYTNAGKSTLLNALTHSEAEVEDKMFATLDPKIRLISNPSSQKCLLVDTVGFINNLPHALIEAFHATLEEVASADLLIHVLDASHHRIDYLKKSVEQVLAEIQASTLPTILVLNKGDLLDSRQKKIIQELWPYGIMISAKNKEGLQNLYNEINRLAL